MANSSQSEPKTRNVGFTFLVLAGSFMVFLIPSTFVLLMIGLAPTWVAVFVERGNHARVHTTAALNFAGVMPFVQTLWAENGGIMRVFDMLGNVYVWGVMYGSAAIAVAFLWLGPQLAALYLEFQAARYHRQLVKQRDAVLAEWGDALKDETKADTT